MATFHHKTNQPQASYNSPDENQLNSYGNPKVTSSFHSIDSLMKSYCPNPPIDQACDTQEGSGGLYSGPPDTDSTQNYLSSLWEHSLSNLFYNYPATQSHSLPSCDQLNISPERANCLLGSGFMPTQQPRESHLSVNPFQDLSTSDFNKKQQYATSQCSEVSPVLPSNVPVCGGNDEILDVDGYTPFGSPADVDATNQTNPGPCSTSSTGYSSGYQSCEGSTDNSPYRSLSMEHLLHDFQPNQIDTYNHDAYIPRHTPLPPSSLPDQSPSMPEQATQSLAVSNILSAGTSSPPSEQTAHLAHTTESSVLLVPTKSEPEAPVKTGATDDTQVKTSRVKYSSAQLAILEKAFIETPYPDWDEMEELSKKLDIAEQKIKVWFQNKRARWRKKHSAQQIQEVSDIKAPMQTSVLYRFPTSFQPNVSCQKTAINFPGHTQGSQNPHWPLPGQLHYNGQPQQTRPSLHTGAMSAGSQLHTAFNRSQTSTTNHCQNLPMGSSPAYYQPHMMNHIASGVSHNPQSNYNYGQMANNYMYPFM